jgi:hypothetical protein
MKVCPCGFTTTRRERLLGIDEQLASTSRSTAPSRGRRRPVHALLITSGADPARHAFFTSVLP